MSFRNSCYTFTKLHVSSVLFRNPWDLSSAFTALGSLQPRTLGFLNYWDPSDSASNHYMVQTFIKHSKLIDGKDTTWLCKILGMHICNLQLNVDTIALSMNHTILEIIYVVVGIIGCMYRKSTGNALGLTQWPTWLLWWWPLSLV